MNTLVNNEPIAIDVWFDDTMLHVQLIDERIISVPFKWFPRLANATKKQRNNWRFSGRGIGIHWEDIDEDLSVAGLLQPNKEQDKIIKTSIREGRNPRTGAKQTKGKAVAKTVGNKTGKIV